MTDNVLYVLFDLMSVLPLFLYAYVVFVFAGRCTVVLFFAFIHYK